MLKLFLPRDNTPPINAVAVAQSSEPMTSHAMILGAELKREQLERKYEHAVLTLAVVLAINVGAIVWFLLSQEGVCLILDHGLSR